MKRVINVVLAGLGGQGVITASDILSEAAFRSGFEVKKSEIHGMSQRGGSVTSDVRFGPQVLSPMVPPGEADFLVVLAPDQVEVNRGQLRAGGVLIAPDLIDPAKLSNRKSFNVALLGALSTHLATLKLLRLESFAGSIRSGAISTPPARNWPGVDLHLIGAPAPRKIRLTAAPWDLTPHVARNRAAALAHAVDLALLELKPERNAASGGHIGRRNHPIHPNRPRHIDHSFRGVPAGPNEGGAGTRPSRLAGPANWNGGGRYGKTVSNTRYSFPCRGSPDGTGGSPVLPRRSDALSPQCLPWAIFSYSRMFLATSRTPPTGDNQP